MKGAVMYLQLSAPALWCYVMAECLKRYLLAQVQILHAMPSCHAMLPCHASMAQVRNPDIHCDWHTLLLPVQISRSSGSRMGSPFMSVARPIKSREGGAGGWPEMENLLSECRLCCCRVW